MSVCLSCCGTLSGTHHTGRTAQHREEGGGNAAASCNTAAQTDQKSSSAHAMYDWPTCRLRAMESSVAQCSSSREQLRLTTRAPAGNKTQCSQECWVWPWPALLSFLLVGRPARFCKPPAAPVLGTRSHPPALFTRTTTYACLRCGDNRQILCPSHSCDYDSPAATVPNRGSGACAAFAKPFDAYVYEEAAAAAAMVQ